MHAWMCYFVAYVIFLDHEKELYIYHTFYIECFLGQKELQIWQIMKMVHSGFLSIMPLNIQFISFLHYAKWQKERQKKKKNLLLRQAKEGRRVHSQLSL